MPDLFLERHSPHLPQRMFDLVSDLEAYPRFIPNCKAMEVRKDPAALSMTLTAELISASI